MPPHGQYRRWRTATGRKRKPPSHHTWLECLKVGQADGGKLLAIVGFSEFSKLGARPCGGLANYYLGAYCISISHYEMHRDPHVACSSHWRGTIRLVVRRCRRSRRFMPSLYLMIKGPHLNDWSTTAKLGSAPRVWNCCPRATTAPRAAVCSRDI